MAFSSYTALTLATQPAFSVGNCTLSNDNLTFEAPNNNGAQIYNDSWQSEGSYYFEMTITAIDGYGGIAVGICNIALVGNNFASTNACVVNPGTGNVYINGDTAFSFGAFGAGTVLSVCVALPNLIWFAINGGNWNNNPSANPATGVGGVSINSSTYGTITMPANVVISAAYSATVNFNFGQTAYAYPDLIPELFSNWPQPQQIVLNPVSSVVGNGSLSLSGTAALPLSAGLDYSVDNSATWTLCTGLSGAESFAASGPSFAVYTNEDIIVRDPAKTYAVSNAENFSAGPAPPGVQVFFDNFEEYTDLADMESAGWTFTGQNETYNPIGTPVGGSSKWLCLNGGGTQTASFANAYVFWDTGVSKLTFSFDMAAVNSSNGFFNGAYNLGTGSNVSNYVSIVNIQVMPDQSDPPFTSYHLLMPSAGPSTTGTITNVKHHFDISIDFTQAAPPWSISVDGEEIYSGELPTDISGSTLTAFYATNYNGAEIQFDNIGVYNTGQFIDLDAAHASYGQRVALSGTFPSGYSPTGLQYEVGSSGTWTNVLTYGQVDDTWTGYGPIANTFTPQTITVRDANNASIVSNSLTFEAQNGVFVWNDVRIN